MAVLQIDPILPELTPAQSLTGLRREFCVELLGDGSARIFVRAVATSSFKAAQLQRATLFQRLDARFTDLAGCVEAVRVDLERLADTAKRTSPAKENLFSCVEIEQATWERVQQGVDRWGRRTGLQGTPVHRVSHMRQP